MLEKHASQVGPTRTDCSDLLEVLADDRQPGPQLTSPIGHGQLAGLGPEELLANHLALVAGSG